LRALRTIDPARKGDERAEDGLGYVNEHVGDGDAAPERQYRRSGERLEGIDPRGEDVDRRERQPDSRDEEDGRRTARPPGSDDQR
jgi:hypothetical protein